MGVGTPLDIIAMRSNRASTCSIACSPRAQGRHGQAFTWDGKLNLTNAAFAEDTAPARIEASACPAACDYARAYLHHLFKAKEYLGPMLTSWANVQFLSGPDGRDP